MNLVKQYAQAGLKDKIPFLSAFTVDETTLPAQGAGRRAEFRLAMGVQSRQRGEQAVRRGFETEYGYAPSVYASQAYDAARLIDGALKKAGGNADKAALRAALEEAPFESVRGDFKFNTNHYPVQDFYVVEGAKRDDGKYIVKVVEKVFDDQGDAYASECKM